MGLTSIADSREPAEEESVADRRDEHERRHGEPNSSIAEHRQSDEARDCQSAREVPDQVHAASVGSSWRSEGLAGEHGERSEPRAAGRRPKAALDEVEKIPHGHCFEVSVLSRELVESRVSGRA